MTSTTQCPVCEGTAEYRVPPSADGGDWSCSRCGEFYATGTAESILTGDREFPAAAISGWIRHQNRAGITPKFNGNNVNSLVSLTKPDLRERLDRYLLTAASLSSTLGVDFNASRDELIGSSYSDNNEIGFIVRCLEVDGFLEHRPGGQYRLTPKGYIAADELRAHRAASSQAFVAMWFATQMADTFENGFSPAITGAGYVALRIDQKEHANKVDDEIVAEIRRSAFVVADFTGHRGGVYFEAGFAMGLGLPVIWTCREDDIKELHFDIRQYNCIDWKNAKELKRRLQTRIEALLGRGPSAPEQS